MDEQYEIQRIFKKKTKNNQNYYLVKWYGFPEKTWRHQTQLDYAKHYVQAFQKKLKFKTELKQYVSEKKERKELEEKNVIILDSQQQAKKVICIISSQDQVIQVRQQEHKQDKQQEQGKSNDKDDSSKLNEPVAIIQQIIDEQSAIIQQQIPQVVQQPAQQHTKQHYCMPIEDQVSNISQNSVVEVKGYNYLNGNWQIQKKEKKKLLSKAEVKQSYQAYKSFLPPITILRAVLRDEKKFLLFECKGQKYQISYDTMKKYRSDELVEFYQKKKDLYSYKLFNFKT